MNKTDYLTKASQLNFSNAVKASPKVMNHNNLYDDKQPFYFSSELLFFLEDQM